MNVSSVTALRAHHAAQWNDKTWQEMAENDQTEGDACEGGHPGDGCSRKPSGSVGVNSKSSR